MIKKLISIIIILILVFTVFPVNLLAEGNDVILNDNSVIENDNTGIPDKYLYQAILRTLGKNENEKFTKQEATSIKVLDAAGNDQNRNKIKTLKGIENLTGLTALGVEYNELTNLAGIENLTNLVGLTAHHNKLTNLKEVRNLTKLTSLSVFNNKITSAAEIEALTELVYLAVSKNKLATLPNLTNLIKLNAHDTYFQFNLLSSNELKSKLPSQLLENSSWLKEQRKFQNINRKLKLNKPKSIRRITKKTKMISGKAHKGAKVGLYNARGKKIKLVKVNEKGTFTLKKLNLKKMSGKKLRLSVYLVSNYYGEDVSIASVIFKVKKK